MAPLLRSRRLVVVDEAGATCSIAAEIIATIAEAGISLKSPPLRVTRPNIPVGFSPSLEKAADPSSERIIEAVRQTLDN